MKIDNLVSVIIPVYNVEKFVKEAIESIQNQTYDNLEIIVIDDCSTDNTYKIVENLAKNDERIKLYKNEKNLKIVKTLNRALILSNGEYIVRMDGDDISTTDRVETLLNFMIENPKYSLVGSAYEGIDEDGKIRGVSKVPTSQELIEKTILLSSPVSHIWIAKKEVYDILNGYRADTVEDYDFLLRMKTSNLLFTNIDKVLYKVRLRDGNTASTQGLKQAKAHQYVVKLYKERLYKNKDSYTDKNFILAIKSSKLEDIIHQKSQIALKNALSSSGLKKIFFSTIAIILSIHTFKYVIRRVKYKFIMKNHNKGNYNEKNIIHS